MNHKNNVRSNAYREAGVDIDLATSLLQQVKGRIALTQRPEVLAPVGGFGGLFKLDLSAYSHPVMVTSIDGVGTKLKVAAMMNRHDTVGYDIVHHCINDIAVQGAEPLYFMDYIGIGRLRSPLYEEVLTGMADACAAQNVSLLGGETAEMPGMYGDDYDLVGCITGIVEHERVITGADIRVGHAVIGLGSNGLHTNGYSLARRVLFETAGLTVDSFMDELGETVGDALLRPHTCYWPAIKSAMADGLPLAGVAHITGGGLFDNVPRVLPEGTEALCETGVLPVPPIFSVIETAGGVDAIEMYRVFNMGIGMVWFVPQTAVDSALRHCSAAGIESAVIGEVIAGDRGVTLRGWEV